MSQYDVYNNFRNELLTIATAQLKITRDLKLDEVQATGQKVGGTLENLISRLNSSQFLVLLVGVFNAGKSTFINALIGQKLLPTAKVPTTGVLCRIIYGEEHQKKITLYPKPGAKTPRGDKPFDIKIEQLKEYVAIDHDKSGKEADSPYDRMEMYWSLDLCKNGVEIIDSVGLDDPASRDRITLDYLQKADAVLYLIPCDHACAGKDMAAIQEIRTMGFSSPFFILTHADSLEDEDDGGAAVRAFTKKNLADKTELGEKGLLYVNSKGAIEAKSTGNQALLAKTGITEIEAALESFLVKERGRSKIFINLFALQEQNRLVSEAMRLRDGMLRQSVSDLKEKLLKMKEPLQKLKDQKGNLLDWARVAIDKIVMDVYSTAEVYFSKLPAKVEVWGKEYQIHNSAGFIPRPSTIEPIVKEVADYLRTKIEEDIASWNSQTLTPMLTEEIDRIGKKINESGSKFDAGLASVRSHIVPNVSADANVISEQTQPKMWERVVSGATAAACIATGGTLAIAGALGSVHGVQAMVTNIVAQVVASIVGFYVLGLALGPGVILIIITGVLHALYQGTGIGDKIKQKTCEKMVEGMEKTRHESAKKLQDQIRSNLMNDIHAALADVLERDISSLESELTNQIEERNKTSFDIEAEQKVLESARSNNDDIHRQLARIAEQTVALR